jgi:hypothetical protein
MLSLARERVAAAVEGFAGPTPKLATRSGDGRGAPDPGVRRSSAAGAAGGRLVMVIWSSRSLTVGVPACSACRTACTCSRGPDGPLEIAAAAPTAAGGLLVDGELVIWNGYALVATD